MEYSYMIPILIVLSLIYYRYSSKSIQKLDNKTILLTGGCQGIGEQLAIILLTQCNHITLHIIDISYNHNLQNIIPIQSNNTLLIHQLDITQPHKINTLIQSIQPIDILINNAGIFINGSVESKTIDQIEKTIQVNLLAGVRLIKLLLPEMIKRGGQITNICSLTKDITSPCLADYSCSKAGLYMFNRTLRQEIKQKQYNINTLIVSPYVLDGGMFGGFKVPFLTTLFKPLKHNYVAQRIYLAILQGEEEIVIPGYMWLIAILMNTFSVTLLDWLANIFLKNSCKDVKKRQ